MKWSGRRSQSMNKNSHVNLCFTTPAPLSLNRNYPYLLHNRQRCALRRIACSAEEPNNGKRRPPIFKTVFKTIPLHLVNALKSRIGKLRKKKKVEPQASDEEWLDLVTEFEERTNKRFSKDSGSGLGVYETLSKTNKLPLNSPYFKHMNPEIFKYAPTVEVNIMAAITAIMWFVGRIYRMESFLILFYPVPTMYIAARWGLKEADLCLGIILFHTLLRMGPIFMLMYLLNNGLLTLVYSRYLWYRWSWRQGLLAGAVAKGVGVVITFVWVGSILNFNAWELLTLQIGGMLTTLVSQLSRFIPLFKSITVSPPYVQAGVFTLIFFACVYQVVCTLIVASVFLLKVNDRVELTREPKDLPFVTRLLARIRGVPSK